MAELTGAFRPEVAATQARARVAWPWVGTVAGALGFVATMLGDIHVATDNRDALTSMAVVSQIDQQKAHLSIVTGFISVAMLLVLAANWRGTVERNHPQHQRRTHSHTRADRSG